MFPVAALVLPLAGLIIPLVVAAAEPALPRAYTDTTYVSATGKSIAVAAGGNFDVRDPGASGLLQRIMGQDRPGH